MDRNETIALLLSGREAWETWAEIIFNEKKSLVDTGRWLAATNWNGNVEPQNEETRAWMIRATADFSRCHFVTRGLGETLANIENDYCSGSLELKSIQLNADSVDFNRFHFPGDALFAGAIFTGNVMFGGATFYANAWFGNVTFAGPADFEKAVFVSDAHFESASFGGPANFGSVIFRGDAWFGSTKFTGRAWFESVTFAGDASFGNALFIGDAWLGRTTFTGDAWFGSTAFNGIALFRMASFIREARFGAAVFNGGAWFEGVSFDGNVFFKGVQFKRNIAFTQARFQQYATFDSVSFTGDTSFGSAIFAGEAWFGSATFTGNAFFSAAHFRRNTVFALARFYQHATFEAARFDAVASFEAILGERRLSMAHTVFRVVPSFVQAHFEEAPRLDNLEVARHWISPHSSPQKEEPQSRRQKGWHTIRYHGGMARTWPERAANAAWLRMRKCDYDIPARWRALKRLAIQGHDTDRELEFHARELRSQRFIDDWPIPLFLWRAKTWRGFFRFWFGIFYELCSDFGRSIARPLLLLLVTTAVFAFYFLSGQSYVADAHRANGSRSAAGTGTVASYVRLIPALWRHPPPCFGGTGEREGLAEAGPELTGLVPPVITSTNALYEAIRLALRNASVVLDGGEDAMYRTYGCLYGIQRYNGNPVPFVPGFVSDASGAQKVLSTLFIFLFGLALRNMLKMK